MQQDLKKRFYSVPELARAFGVSDQSIYNLMNSGVIGCVRFGRRRLMPAEDEPKLIAQFKVDGAA